MRRIDRTRALVFNGAIGLFVSAPALAANLLLNASFESPTDNNSTTDATATGWTLYGNELRAQSANDPAFGGNWGMLHETSLTGGGGVYQDVGQVSSGTPFTLTAWQYFQQSAPDVPGLVSDLALTFVNYNSSNGTYEAVGPVDANGFSDATYTPAATAATDIWTQFTVTGVAPAGANAVQVSFDFVNGSTVSGPQSIFVDDADLEAGEPPPRSQWDSTGSGDWNLAGNWTSGVIPNAIGAEADLLSAPGITSNSTVYTNTAITVGTLKFDNANEYEIAGTGSLTLQSSVGNALVAVNQATDILDLPVTVAGNTTFDMITGATLVIGDPLMINSGVTLTEAGAVNFLSTISLGPGARIVFAGSAQVNELLLNKTEIASVAGKGTELQVDSMSNDGTLDVGDNTVLVNYGNSGSGDPIASIRAELASGYAGGAWSGAGIDSSAAASNARYGVGYADSADSGNPANLSSGTIEVKYALYGDANLDGVVDGTDLAILAANFGKPIAQWDEGDFNYDGEVGAADFALLAENFSLRTNDTEAQLPTSDWTALDAFAAANGLLADVPEPAVLGMLAVAAALSSRRYRGAHRTAGHLTRTSAKLG